MSSVLRKLVERGDVELAVSLRCPCCGKAVTVELTGGQVVAKKGK